MGDVEHAEGDPTAVEMVPGAGLALALVWLTRHGSAKIRAFADAATTVLASHGAGRGA